VQLNFTQPIQNAFDELLSGIKAQIAVKVFGEDLDMLQETAAEIKEAIEDVPGLVDLSVEQSFGQPQVQIAVDRAACARYGIPVSDVLELVELAIGGEPIDQILLNTRRFGIHVRYQEAFRAGAFVEYGGQFENQQRAMRRLSIIVPIVIIAVFILLWMTFGAWRDAFIIIVNIPLALIGGIFGLLVTREYLSVPAAVGFIALFGIAVQNGVVLVSYFNQLRREGESLSDAVIEGGMLRLRPVLMTALTSGIGLIPVLYGSRRLNCLGILLLPIARNMSGFGISIAAVLGLA